MWLFLPFWELPISLGKLMRVVPKHRGVFPSPELHIAFRQSVGGFAQNRKNHLHIQPSPRQNQKKLKI